MNAPSTFSSECPKCLTDRVQFGYAPEELRELLECGAEIQAYCSNCDEHWVVSTEERADIASGLTRKGKPGR